MASRGLMSSLRRPELEERMAPIFGDVILWGVVDAYPMPFGELDLLRGVEALPQAAEVASRSMVSRGLLPGWSGPPGLESGCSVPGPGESGFSRTAVSVSASGRRLLDGESCACWRVLIEYGALCRMGTRRLACGAASGSLSGLAEALRGRRAVACVRRFGSLAAVGVTARAHGEKV